VGVPQFFAERANCVSAPPHIPSQSQRQIARTNRSYFPPAAQIRFFLLQNRQGKTRLSKWYVAIEEADKRKIENEVHRLVTARDSKFTNFVEVSVW
jgi:hypothetical protein